MTAFRRRFDCFWFSWARAWGAASYLLRFFRLLRASSNMGGIVFTMRLSLAKNRVAVILVAASLWAKGTLRRDKEGRGLWFFVNIPRVSILYYNNRSLSFFWSFSSRSLYLYHVLEILEKKAGRKQMSSGRGPFKQCGSKEITEKKVVIYLYDWISDLKTWPRQNKYAGEKKIQSKTSSNEELKRK